MFLVEVLPLVLKTLACDYESCVVHTNEVSDPVYAIIGTKSVVALIVVAQHFLFENLALSS